MCNYIDLYELAAKTGCQTESLYRASRNHKLDFLEFMDLNNWFGCTYEMKEATPWIHAQDADKIIAPLKLWLAAYRKPGHEKLVLMLERYSSIYPNTCGLYKRFVTDRQLMDIPSAWKLLDFVLSELSKELTEFDETDVERLVQKLEDGATRSVAQLFADFLSEININGAPISNWTYTFKSRERTGWINTAYPMDDYAVAAYCVFNEEMWARQGLVEKAVGNKTYAGLWLFIAMHFLCAIRPGDLERLPAPALPYSNQTVLDKIANNVFTEREAAAIVDEFILRLELKPLKPSKTSGTAEVPNLTLYVPESLKAPFGIIVAIALAHHTEIHTGEGFIKPVKDLANIRAFFGKEFMLAMGGKRISSQRLNKTYLQGIEVYGGDEQGKPKGYMLASLARSHKSGIGRLSETTDVYLKDARFSGYKPEFIILQMFERGVFSFIPSVLLETYAGPSYIRLPITSQTKLIGELGLSAFQIEGIGEAMKRAMIRSRKAVAEALKLRPGVGGGIGAVLQNIASGNSPSRQTGCLCLLSAVGAPCPKPDHGSCIGCGYEIYTKSIMYTLVSEYRRMLDAKALSGGIDAKRRQMILEQAILPAISEMLMSAKVLYPDADITELLNIIEDGLNGAHRVDGGNK